VLACAAEGVEPDVVLLGKALGGGVLPVSAVVADRDVLGVLRPGQHGSTFGGNPLACAVGSEVVRILAEGSLLAHTRALGEVLAARLDGMPGLTAVRSRGLWAGIDIDPAIGTGREVSERLALAGVLTKDTHGPTLRLAPPLVITEPDLHRALDVLETLLSP
jgi:ornithine--oxo-acid transaminase